MVEFTPEACYRAGQSRDPRFDGRFFTGVKTTGIYCRPICPARTPRFENCRYFRSAASAQEAGFRPCLRCRPEVSPEFAFWRGTSNTVSRALALISEGAMDAETSVEQLADRLGIGERQLRRLFHEHLGASPISVIQTRRVLFAKQLIHETHLPMSEIAMAAGFGSIRRFNDTFRKLYNRPPSTLRRAAPAGTEISLQLTYRPPYDWDAMLLFFKARAIPGVELVKDGKYYRTARPGALIEVGHSPERNALSVKVRVPQVSELATLVARVRRVFDVGADIATIEDHLARDPMLAPLVAKRPGLRSPGGWDGFELAVRAVLGQQVSVAAGRTLAGRLVELTGTHVSGQSDGCVPDRLFPTAAEVAAADLERLGMPASRRRTLKALADAAVANPKLFDRSATLEESVKRLCAITGIGEWTAQYIALRALREPDAFPASDLALLRSAANGSGERPAPAELLARAEPWRPWRAYAAQHLWNS